MKATEAALTLGLSATAGQSQARRRRQRLLLPPLASRLAPSPPSSAHRAATLPHTSTFVCRNKQLKSNRNRLHLAVPSSSESTNYCRKLTICRAQSEDSKGGGGFLAGFLIGGAIFGTLGYVFAPQISRTLDSLLDENGEDTESDETGLQRVPRRPGQYYDEGLEKTRQTLGDKISQLNLAIDKAASRLKRVTGNGENEAVKDKTEIGISSLSDDVHVVENEHGFVQGESAT